MKTIDFMNSGGSLMGDNNYSGDFGGGGGGGGVYVPPVTGGPISGNGPLGGGTNNDALAALFLNPHLNPYPLPNFWLQNPQTRQSFFNIPWLNAQRLAQGQQVNGGGLLPSSISQPMLNIPKPNYTPPQMPITPDAFGNPSTPNSPFPGGGGSASNTMQSFTPGQMPQLKVNMAPPPNMWGYPTPSQPLMGGPYGR